MPAAFRLSLDFPPNISAAAVRNAQIPIFTLMRIVIFILAVALASCSRQRMIETNLYFGQSKPGGGMVTAKEWDTFKTNHIIKVFKEGSTVVSVTGNWFDTDKRELISEPTYMVIYFYKPSRNLSRQIDSLRSWYKQQFNQQSVLRVDKKTKASF